MPCSDGIASDHYYRETIEYQKKRLDNVTRLLCSLCRQLEKMEVSFTDFSELGEINVWWTGHKKEDEERERLERIERDKVAEKERILAKLTLEERKILKV